MPGTQNIFLESAGTNGNGTSTGYTTVSGWKHGVESEATNLIADGPNANNNTVGWYLNHARNNHVNDFGASTNTQYGVWLRNSSGNQVNCSGVGNNSIAGSMSGARRQAQRVQFVLEKKKKEALEVRIISTTTELLAARRSTGWLSKKQPQQYHHGCFRGRQHRG